MPDLARNRRTGTVHAAAELPYSPEFHGDKWECLGCPVEMISAAADGAKKYKVAPYFRANGSHAIDCDGDGLRVLAEGGNQHVADGAMGLPAAYPNVLRLAVDRPQVPQGDQVADIDPITRVRQNPDAGGGRNHDHVAGTLYRIAECYVLYPNQRHRPLRIKGVEGDTYATCFKRLTNTKKAVRLPTHVYFAEISFKHIAVEDGVAEVTLTPVLWIINEADPTQKARPGQRYRVRFDTREWTPRRRNGFLGELERQRAEQQQLHSSDADVRVNLFFIGRQDDNDLMLFHVDDPRLACFFPMPKV